MFRKKWNAPKLLDAKSSSNYEIVVKPLVLLNFLGDLSYIHIYVSSKDIKLEYST